MILTFQFSLTAFCFVLFPVGAWKILLHEISCFAAVCEAPASYHHWDANSRCINLLLFISSTHPHLLGKWGQKIYFYYFGTQLRTVYSLVEKFQTELMLKSFGKVEEWVSKSIQNRSAKFWMNAFEIRRR